MFHLEFAGSTAKSCSFILFHLEVILHIMLKEVSLVNTNCEEKCKSLLKVLCFGEVGINSFFNLLDKNKKERGFSLLLIISVSI